MFDTVPLWFISVENPELMYLLPSWINWLVMCFFISSLMLQLACPLNRHICKCYMILNWLPDSQSIAWSGTVKSRYALYVKFSLYLQLLVSYSETVIIWFSCCFLEYTIISCLLMTFLLLTACVNVRMPFSTHICMLWYIHWFNLCILPPCHW